MLCIATIVSANYLAYAKTLVDSVRIWEPGAVVRVLIVDRDDPEVRHAIAELGLNVVFAQDLGIPDFEEVAFKYDIVELNTALKPTFLKSLLAEGFEQVWYMDPDIQVFREVQPIRKALETSSIALTPHSLAPVMDGRRPSDIDFLRTGSYNLGFIAVKSSKESKKMLDWWESRCLSYGFNDLGFGTFVDQKWMDLVPAYFSEVAIVKDPGCNVAYWNLHERDLSETNGSVTVNGEPLYFFHFSGVRAENPSVLSKHQTRHQIFAGSILARLVDNYCRCLVSNGHARYSQIAYSFGTFDDGLSVSSSVRRAATFIGNTSVSPFSARGALRVKLDRKRLIAAGRKSSARMTTLNFPADSLKVVWTNRFVRGLVMLLGIDRVAELIRYLSVLNREANLLRVVTKKPLEFSHDERYSRNPTRYDS